MHCIQTIKAENSPEIQKKLKEELGIEYKKPKTVTKYFKGDVEYELTPKVSYSQKVAYYVNMATA